MIGDARHLVASLAPAYLPRRPTETVLYGLVRQNLESFLAYAREHYDGGLPRYVEQELRAYLDVRRVFGRASRGAHCDACGHDLLVAFSCRSRSICPSCAGRRMANTAASLGRSSSPSRRARAPVRPVAAVRASQARRVQGGRADGAGTHLRRGDLRELPRTRQAWRDRGRAVRRGQFRSKGGQPR